MDRRAIPLIAGNWKMFKGPGEAAAFCSALAVRLEGLAGVAAVVCPPYVSLGAASAALSGSPVRVFAQNVHWQETGAFTGEISPAMLLEAGAVGTIVGHSERRQHFGDTDDTVARRAAHALEAGLDVIACVGEIEAEREAGRDGGGAAPPGRRDRGRARAERAADVSPTSPSGRSAPAAPRRPSRRRRRTR